MERFSITSPGCSNASSKAKKLDTLLEMDQFKETGSDNKIMLKLDVGIQDYTSLFIDTGAGCCLIKQSALKSGTIIDTDQICILGGINSNGSPLFTLGKVLVNITLDNDVTIQHHFNVVSDDLPFQEGIVGLDFFKKFRAELFYKDNKINIYFSEDKYISIPMIFNNPESSIIIPARTEMMIKIVTSYEKPVMRVIAFLLQKKIQFV